MLRAGVWAFIVMGSATMLALSTDDFVISMCWAGVAIIALLELSDALRD